MSRVTDVADIPVEATTIDDSIVFETDTKVVQLRKCSERLWIALGKQDVKVVLAAIKLAFPEEAKACGLQ